MSDLVSILSSGLLGAVAAQLLAMRHTKKLEVRRAKLAVVTKIAGNRAAVSERSVREQSPRFFEGLNEVMVVFADSRKVSEALVEYKKSLGTENDKAKLVELFKAICRDVGIKPKAFNESLFLEPFTPGG